MKMLTARYFQENGRCVCKWIAECTIVQAREIGTVKDGLDSFLHYITSFAIP